MTVFLQAAIPVFVTFAVLALIAIINKYFKAEIFVLCGALLVSGILLTVQHSSATKTQEETEKQSAETYNINIMLVNQLLQDEMYDEVREILLDISQNSIDSDEVLLSQARCEILAGNYTKATGLYSQLKDTHAEEAEIAQQLSAANAITDAAIQSYLNGSGNNAATPSPVSVTAKTTVDEKALKDKIKKNIVADFNTIKEKNDEATQSAVEDAAKIYKTFNDFVNNNKDNSSKAKKYVNSLAETMEANKSLNKNKYLRIARMKGYVLSGDYSKLSSVADEYLSSEELTVLSELYVSNRITKKDFKSEYFKVDEEGTKKIIEHCESVLEAEKPNLDSAQVEKYTKKIEQMKQHLNDPVIFILRNDLNKSIEHDTVMRSKNYLALAKLEKKCGNTELSRSYIDKALGTAGDSNDSNYSVPMYQLSSIVNGASEIEEIKNVADYVDKAIDYSLPTGITTTDIGSAPSSSVSGFDDEMGNYIKEITAKINIGIITKDNFPEVKAKVQIQSDEYVTVEELKKHLQVSDCGNIITDFTLERIEFDRSDIILLCDVSGSMSGSMDLLRNSVVKFADKMQKGERVAVVGFESSVTSYNHFTEDPETVKSYANQLHSGGGTKLYSSTVYCMDKYTTDLKTNNILIAMTDGQDSDNASFETMKNELGALAALNGVTVYTLGMGDVNVNYLQNLALSGNGSFLYADDFAQLDAFYDFIHGQLKNQYILTFTAKNQTLNERELVLSLDGENGTARKTYYLKDNVQSGSQDQDYVPLGTIDGELSVNGLAEKFVYKSSKDQTILLKGSQFDKGDDISVIINGAVKYTLQATFVDANTYSILIPSSIATGQYDLSVAIRDKNFTFENEFTVAVPGTERNFKFGDYNFTALSTQTDSNGNTILSGNVVMNGWLRFKGDITIEKHEENIEKVKLTDNAGSYISYDPDTATGLAQLTSKIGITIPVSAFGDFYIYNNPYHPSDYESFPTESIEKPDNILDWFFLTIDDMDIILYPDMLKFEGFNFSLGLPHQDLICPKLKNQKIGSANDLLCHATKIAYSGKHSMAIEDTDAENMKTSLKEFVFFSLPLSLTKAEVEVDTITGEFSLDFSVKFKSMLNMDGLDLAVAFKNFAFDGFKIQSQTTKALSLMKTPVPVSMSDFGIELEGLSANAEDPNFLDRILSSTVSALFKVNCASLKDEIPKLYKIVDKKGKNQDLALATLDNCKLSVTLKEFQIQFTTDVKLLDKISVGKASITIGKFNYTNELIGYNNESQSGLQASIQLGDTWSMNNLDLTLTGTSTLTLGYPFTGLHMNGVADFDLRWKIVKVDFDVSGDFLLGIYKNTSGNCQFSIIVRGTNTKGEHSGFHLYCTKNTGIDTYIY